MSEDPEDDGNSGVWVRLDEAIELVKAELARSGVVKTQNIIPHPSRDSGVAAAVRAGQGRRDVLPASLPPRGLSRHEAAAYIGVGPTLFDSLVEDGRMPQPREINSRRVWDRIEIDQAFSALPHAGGSEQDVWDKCRA